MEETVACNTLLAMIEISIYVAYVRSSHLNSSTGSNSERRDEVHWWLRAGFQEPRHT